MKAGAMTPPGLGVRQPSGALAGEPIRSKAAEGRRTARRYCALQVGELPAATLRRSRRCGLLALIMWCFAFATGAVAQSTATNAIVRFRTVDVFVDAKDQPLAAYQLEFAVTNTSAKIVGIEGGEHPAFAQPPFYDPKAMQHERVIIAAFSTEAADKLPKEKTRVATIHLQTRGKTELGFDTKLQTDERPEKKKITPEESVEERNPQ